MSVVRHDRCEVGERCRRARTETLYPIERVSGETWWACSRCKAAHDERAGLKEAARTKVVVDNAVVIDRLWGLVRQYRLDHRDRFPDYVVVAREDYLVMQEYARFERGKDDFRLDMLFGVPVLSVDAASSFVLDEADLTRALNAYARGGR